MRPKLPRLHAFLPNLATGLMTVTVLVMLALAFPTLGWSAPAKSITFPALNRPAVARQFPGKFIWADLFSNEPAKAAKFYCDLLGWTSASVLQDDFSYIVLSNGGQPVAGIVQREATSKRPGAWIAYISVKSVKSTLAAVKKAGGTTYAPAHDFPNRGIEAIIADSEGAVLGILQSSTGDPADDEPNTGEWNWFELFSLAPKDSSDFYHRVFGYDVKPDMRVDRSPHLLLSKDDHPRAGMASLPVSKDSKPGWMGSVRVADIEATAAKAVKLGGKILIAPRPAAQGSRFAVVADPSGAAISLVQYIDSENPKDRP